MGAAGGLRGVMEVTPYGHDRNFRGLAAPGGLRLPPPSPGSKKDRKKIKQQSSDGTGRVGRIEAARGVMEVTPFRPPVILVLGFGGFPAKGGGGVREQGGGGFPAPPTRAGTPPPPRTGTPPLPLAGTPPPPQTGTSPPPCPGTPPPPSAGTPPPP